MFLRFVPKLCNIEKNNKKGAYSDELPPLVVLISDVWSCREQSVEDVDVSWKQSAEVLVKSFVTE